VIGEETAAYIMSGLIGIPYPEGDPEILRAGARHWRKISAIMAESEKVAERSAAVMAEAAQSGAAITSFHELVDDVLPRLNHLRQATEALAVSLEKFAEHLQKIKEDFNYIAWKVAVDIGVTVAFGFLTVGLHSAVTALYLTRTFVVAFQIFGAYRRAALITALVATYYAVDSFAYAALDVGAVKLVDLYYGRNEVTWGTFGRTFAANVAFDMAFDAQGAVVGKVLGPRFANDVWVRVAMRMAASGLVYTPSYQMLGGEAPALPDQDAWEQKGVIHAVGRTMFSEHYRDASREAGKAVMKSILRR
jgi:hypothetical protein